MNPVDPAEAARRLREAAERRPRPKTPDTPSPAAGADLAAMAADRAVVAWGRTVPSRFVHANVDDLDPDVAEPIRDWARTVTPVRNLVFVGPVGTGKTHAAVAAARLRHDAGHDVLFLPAVELLDRLRQPDASRAVFDDLTHADVLVVDDMGAARDTEWAYERWYAVINRRWMEERPTVVTTNLKSDTLAQSLGEATYSRLVRGAVVVRLAGGDRRSER